MKNKNIIKVGTKVTINSNPEDGTYTVKKIYKSTKNVALARGRHTALTSLRNVTAWSDCKSCKNGKSITGSVELSINEFGGVESVVCKNCNRILQVG